MLTTTEEMIIKDGPNMGHVLTHLEFLAKPNACLAPNITRNQGYKRGCSTTQPAH